MAEIVSTIATSIFDHSIGVIGRQIGYLWNYKKNVNDLQMQVEDLDKERDDKSHCVTVAEKNGERIRERVKRWQNETNKISEEAKEILQEYEEKGKKMCLMDLCPNLLSRYQFGRRAFKKRIKIERAITKADEIREVSDPTVGRGTTRALSTKGMFSFDSRKSTLEDIMKMLQDETKTIIGVYGLGGMGKTTLVKQVASRAAEDKLFEEIALGSVTQTIDMKEIQGQIASQLDLKLEESTVAERAGRIYARLKGKKVLVVLDDLWKELDVKQVGIPFPTEHMGCKILLTSRFRPVLASMGTEEEFFLGALKEEEAWKLFEERTVNIVRKPAFHTIGKEVAKRCEGLPVLIVTVAASLSKRPHLHAWKDALKQLKRMNYKEIHDIVNSAIESISYKHLEETHRKLFLLCGVMGGDVSIEEVLQYGLGWGLFDEEAMTIEQARNSLHTMILNLKESCLLLEGDNRRDRNSIIMHDVVRDVSISIAKKDFNLFSVGDNNVELWPKEDVLRRCTGIIFRSCPDLSRLTQLLACPLLELLVVSGSSGDSSRSIPDAFFEETNKLRVLGMSGKYFSALPSSLSSLKNLQALRIDSCYSLEDISIVGELKKLQTLSLANSSIEELPSGIRQLSELRLLDLSHCSKLEIIPAGLIASLSRLEELYMRGGFDRWDVGECLNSSGNKNASLAELNHLPKLYSLEIGIPNAKLLSKIVSCDKWEKYEIIVGDRWGLGDAFNIGWLFKKWLNELEITRKLCLELDTTSMDYLQHGFKKLFKDIECLCLGKSQGIKNVTPELDEDGFPNMKHLRIKQDKEIQYIVNAENKQRKVSFPTLESLHLIHMLKLQKIYNGHWIEESFYNLKIVKVGNCNILESLFSFSAAIGLRCLQEIQVSNCSALEKIVAEKNREEADGSSNDRAHEQIEFLQLRKLSLKCLPKLSNFLSAVSQVVQKEDQTSFTTDVESEEIISEGAEFISSMPLFEKVSFPKMETLELSNIANLTEIWNHQVHETPYCNLTILSVSSCDNMKYLLTPSIIMSLVGLQELNITSCARMKQVVAKEKGEAKMGTISFPQLSKLRLSNLSNLTTFYSRSVEEMDAKENLEADVQPLFSKKVTFPSLKQLEIMKCDAIKTIWPTMSRGSHEILSFQTLQQVGVYACRTLEHVIPSSVAQSLNQLEELSIQDCDVETIIGDDKDTKLEEIKAGDGSMIFTFPKLIKFELKRLSKLKCFYPRESTTKWPALEKLEVCDCDKIEIFTGLTQIQPSMFPLFSIEKVAFPSSMSFRNLLVMKINGFAGLNYLFTPSIAMGLEKVQELTITKCSMIKAIVGNEGREATIDTTITFPHLICLWLEDLPNLTRLYSAVEEMDSNKNPDYNAQSLFNEKIQFPRLEQLTIAHLDSIDNIWQNQHIYQVNSFSKLKEVEIRSCASLLKIFSSTESIIGDENCMESSEEMATTFVFPELTHLRLTRLPKVEFFYPRKHTIEWPALKLVDVVDCDKVSTFDFLYNMPGKQGANQLVKAISNLEILSVRGQDMMKILRLFVKLPLHLFQGLKSLTITEFHSEATVFLSKFLGMIHSHLQTFRVYNCSFQEIFLYEGEVTEHADGDILLPQLRELLLEKLPELKYIYKQDQCSSFILNVFGTLRTLNVVECPCLSNLVPSSASFRLLKHMTILSCDGLINLIQPSTARSLENLEMLSICDCEMIEEIIGGEGRDGDEEPSSCDNEIIFRKLWRLALEKLPRLTNFCPSRNYTFTFPKLVVVTVTECPNMKTFCGGIITTPKLTRVRYGSERCWEGDLNATVERFFTEMESKRLATTLPQPQTPENLAEYLNEPRQERQAATNQEKVADISEKGKGKEVVEHFEKSEETSCHSDPSCSNYAAQEQNLTAYLPTSQHVVSSSTQLEVQTPAATISATSSSNQVEAGAQIHDKSPKISTVEPRKEAQICRNDSGELGIKAEIHKNGTKPGKESEEGQGHTIVLPSTSSNNELTQPTKEGQISRHVIDELGNKAEVSAKTTNLTSEYCQNANEPEQVTKTCEEVLEGGKAVETTNACEICPCLVTQARTRVEASNSEQKDFQDFIPLFNESFRALRARPMSSISAKQVQFMKEARDWLDAYVEKATECLERNEALSELKREIAEKLAKMQTLEDEIEATASSIPNFR